MKTIQDMQGLGQAIKETIQAGKMMDVISLLGMDICIRNRGE